MATRRRVLVLILSLLTVATSLGLFGPSVGADEGAVADVMDLSQKSGIELVRELGLDQIPSSGYAEDVDCSYATEVDGAVFCLDPVAGDWTEARLVAARIRGDRVTDEMAAVAQAQEMMLAAETALGAARAEGAPPDELQALLDSYLDARQAFEAAVTEAEVAS